MFIVDLKFTASVPASASLTCFIPVLFTSTLPVVAPITMRNSLSFHHMQTVR
jgi:hypothetical protein